MRDTVTVRDHDGWTIIRLGFEECAQRFAIQKRVTFGHIDLGHEAKFGRGRTVEDLWFVAGVLGGTQSLHTDSFDEAWALPSEQAALIALRTQQIIANESGVANTVDPLGGSWYVEALTTEYEKKIFAILEEVEERGVRFGVRTTGCSGMAYKLEFVDSAEATDQAFESNGVKVFVDPKSLAYIDGTELDFVREGLNEGFKFNNPNEKDKCGCGESFNV